MKVNKQLLVIGVVLSSLYGCSMLGERKESTKVDIDGSPISQIKIIPKKEAEDKTDGKDEDLASLDLSATNLDCSMKLVHPSKNAKEYILEKKINLTSVDTGKPLGRPTGQDTDVFNEMDRPQMFFELGGEIAGRLNIIEPTDANLEQIATSIGRKPEELPYTDAKAHELQAKIIEKIPASEGHIRSIVAVGNAKVSLAKVDLAVLNLSVTERNAIQNHTTDLSKVAPKPFAVTLNQEQQLKMFLSFDPKLDEFTVTMIQFIMMYLPENGDPYALVATVNGFQEVPASNITIKDGVVRIVVEEEVSKNDLQRYKISNGKTLEQITFKSTDQKEDGTEEMVRRPVFTQEKYKQQTTLTFMASSDAPTTTDQPAATQPDEAAPANGSTDQPVSVQPANTDPQVHAQTGSDPVQPTIPDATVDQPSGNETPLSNAAENGAAAKPVAPATVNDPIADVVNFPNNVVNQPDTAGKARKDSTTIAVKPVAVDSAATATRPADSKINASSMEKLVKAYGAKKEDFQHLWFNPTMIGHSKAFYQYNGSKFVYKTDDYNSKFFDTKFFPQSGKTKAQVDEICRGYDYQRSFTLPITVGAPPEASMKPYFTLTATDAKGKEVKKEKSLNDVVLDQFLIIAPPPPPPPPSEGFFGGIKDSFSGTVAAGTNLVREDAIENAITGMLNVPDVVKNQDFKGIICFDEDKKDFRAFWSSSDTERTYTLNQGYADVSGTKNENSWFESQNTEATTNGLAITKFFTRNRSKGFSNINMVCRSKSDCFLTFMLTFRHQLSVANVMAHINEDDMSSFRVEFAESLSTKGKNGKDQVIQSEKVIFGAIPMTTTAAVATEEYISAEKMKNAGLISYPANITESGYTTLPGELADIYFRLIPTKSAEVLAAETYAMRK